MIFDTNVLVYISKNILRIENFIRSDTKVSISVISYIEALGFSFATNQDYHYMHEICSSCNMIRLSDEIVNETISIRKNHKIKLPDAIIYSTALVENVPLITNNLKDFQFIKNQVESINPFDL